MFGINGAELLILLLVALVVVGPERLPGYAEQLARWTRSFRGYVKTAKQRVAEEMGEEVADVDWASLDPRRYDPRRIVREALLDEDPPPVLGRQYTTGARRAAGAVGAAGAVVGGAAAAGRRPASSREGAPAEPSRPLFDADAT